MKLSNADGYLASLKGIKILGSNFVIGLGEYYMLHNVSIFCKDSRVTYVPFGFLNLLFFSFLSFFSLFLPSPKHPDSYINKTLKDNWKNTIGTAQQKVLLAYPWYSEVSGRIKGMSKGHAIILS